MSSQRRYPGATPFTSRQEKIFYGRDKDIEKLLTLILVERKILLYSKSGLGKTSLLEAGVLPKLPPNYIPVSIRLFAYKEGAETPVERVINAIKSVIGDPDAISNTVLDTLAGSDKSNKTLWYYFKKLQFSEPKAAADEPEKIFLLFFDQFEELFSFPQKDIEEFKTQIYELTELKVPDRYAVLIANGRENNQELFNRETISNLHKKIDIKTVFAIRSDRLSQLNALSDKLPGIQNVFHELQPLNPGQTRQAIVNPAADTDPGFETPPFSFHEDALNKIIKELSDGGQQNIETTQLQIVCHRIEEIAAAKKTNGPVQIAVEDLPEFRNIFLNFYFDSINKLPEEKRANANRLIEDELIRNKQRISLDQEICKEYLDEHELRTLVDTHLLRAERNTFGRLSFEISHDTLVEPILESQKKYLDELEKIRLENERQEELRKLREQQELETREREAEFKRIREEQLRKEKERQRKIKWQRTIIAIVSVFLVISLAMIYQVNELRKDARNAEEKAVRALEALRESEYSRNETSGLDFQQKAQYDRAVDSYKIAKDLLDSADDRRNIMDQRIAECQRLIEIKGDNERIINYADDLIRKREYLLAMAEYNRVIEAGYDTVRVHAKRRDLERRAKSIYTKDLADYMEMQDMAWADTSRQRLEKLNGLYNKFSNP
ncbi:MAG: hypothetical protein IH597_12760 [Bacteroidales bacterium]|nr:hypothetical protein [Bacteroidales bacterium]